MVYHNLTRFQIRVYNIVQKVPKGKITTYQEVARALGNSKLARAVGNALKNNPYPIRIPCHRVIRLDGILGGYQAGSLKKKKLLEQEGIKIYKNKIIYFKNDLFKF